jgi:GGDEF domain-containing protein
VDVSIGAATDTAGDLESLLRAADTEMYRVKADHRATRTPEWLGLGDRRIDVSTSA